MATFSVTANELKYASGSSWTSGKARQGVYSTTRYEGAINLAGLVGLDFSNIAVSQIQMRVTFGPAGGDSTKYLTFYKATKNSISGSIASMRGDSIGSITVTEAYNRTVTLTFSATSNAGLFNTFRDYFASGNRVLLIYVPRTRGTYSGGFCYDYLSVTALTMTLTFEYLQSTGAMAASQRGGRQRGEAQYHCLQQCLHAQGNVEIWLVHSDAEHCRRYCLRLIHHPALVACCHPQCNVRRSHGDTGDD